MSCTCMTDAEMTCIVHPKRTSNEKYQMRIAELKSENTKYLRAYEKMAKANMELEEWNQQSQSLNGLLEMRCEKLEKELKKATKNETCLWACKLKPEVQAIIKKELAA